MNQRATAQCIISFIHLQSHAIHIFAHILSLAKRSTIMITIILHAIKYQNIFTITHAHANPFQEFLSLLLSPCCRGKCAIKTYEGWKKKNRKAKKGERVKFTSLPSICFDSQLSVCSIALSDTHKHTRIHISMNIGIHTHNRYNHLPLLITRNRSNPRNCEHLARNT